MIGVTVLDLMGKVCQEEVRIAFVYAALNELDVTAGDIQHAYLTAPWLEKYWAICGPEFGPELQGCKVLIVRALYGTKCAGRDFRNHLRGCMEMFNYQPCLADPDLWMRDNIRSNGNEYYEYVLLMNQYIKETIRNFETYLKERNLALLKTTPIPITKNYSPEVDMSQELDESNAAYYQSLIGILRWIVEMGRVDIITEVSMLSSFVTMPREGHFNQVIHIFAYLKSHSNTKLVLDPSYPEIKDEMSEKDKDRSSYYGDEIDLPPSNAPKAKPKEFVIRACVDASHACCKLTRWSRTGFVVYLNKAQVYSFTKKQGSSEINTFRSEFVAMRQCCNYIRGLRYKLRMMGVPVNNPTLIYGDNHSVLWRNTLVPDSTLKKKSATVAYSYCRDEGVSRNEWIAKFVPSIESPQEKVRMMLYDIYDYDQRKL